MTRLTGGKKPQRRLQQVDVKQLEIERSQVIQLSKQPYWQLSGLNLEGDQLEVKHNNGHWGIWSGKLDASVVNASYDQVITSHAAISTQSDNGFWQLTRLFAPSGARLYRRLRANRSQHHQPTLGVEPQRRWDSLAIASPLFANGARGQWLLRSKSRLKRLSRRSKHACLQLIGRSGSQLT